MTQKRFGQLLMGRHGMSRNDAAVVSAVCREWGIPYSTAYGTFGSRGDLDIAECINSLLLVRLAGTSTFESLISNIVKTVTDTAARMLGSLNDIFGGMSSA